MNSSKQTQKAGDNSQQIQANTIIVNTGIEEKRAREIFKEMFDVARRDFSFEAEEIAEERVSKFEDKLMITMQKIEGALNAFADPSFQFLLRSANKTAASTDRVEDYTLLSELLVHRIERKDSRETYSGVSRAVEIVDKISDESLLGLTAAFAAGQYTPTSGSITEGLNVLDDLFRKLHRDTLPMGENWLEQLDILDAARVSSFGGLKKLEDFYAENMSGYCVIGLKKESEEYSKAMTLLKENGLPSNLLIENELISGYVRIPVVSKSKISNIKITYVVEGKNIEIIQDLTTKQIEVLNKIFDMYAVDSNMQKTVKEHFCEEIEKRKYLNMIKEWWNQIPSAFKITIVGKVLAHSNAKRCDNTLPDLN